MAYLLELGPIEQTLARQAMQMGQPLPDRIANAPELRIGLQFFLQAFFDLDSERSHGLGVTLIPWSSIKDYALTYELEAEESEDLMYLIRQIDVEHTKKIAAKQKQNGKKSK